MLMDALLEGIIICDAGSDILKKGAYELVVSLRFISRKIFIGQRWFALPTWGLVVIVWLPASSSIFARGPLLESEKSVTKCRVPRSGQFNAGLASATYRQMQSETTPESP